MDEKVMQQARKVAILAAQEAGAIIREHFDKNVTAEAKDEHGDIVTYVDLLAEKVILSRIKQAFPDHQLISEESGNNKLICDWLWMVDPLDGTNNYAIGLPVFSCSITLLFQKKPMLAVIYEPMVDRLYVSIRNQGATCNDVLVHMGEEARTFTKATVGWIQGHIVQNDDRAVRLRQHVDIHTRRMMRLFAPTLQWTMLARGQLDAIILYNSEGEDLYSGILMVQEAGGVVVQYDGHPFKEMESAPYLIACHPHKLDYFMNMVREGLGEAISGPAN
nr:inositol monophosphatase family protein [Paenibacillus sp. Marseille-Q4541]